MLTDYFISTAQGLDAIDDFHYMQDGTLPHRTHEVMETLKDHFSERVIGLDYMQRYGYGIAWLRYFPDWNPCDFYL
jgi:hypothetical protein